MSVRKREWITRMGEAKEAWIVDYTDADGDRHIETFTKKKDADARHAIVAVNIGRGTHVAPSKSATVAEAADSWIKRVEADGRERATVAPYRQHIALHIVPRLGKVKLANLTPKTIEGFRDALLADLSRALARKVLVSLRSLLKVAGYMQVAAGITIGHDKRGKRKLEPGVDLPTPAEVKRLIAATTDPRQRALLLTAALTGLRSASCVAAVERRGYEGRRAARNAARGPLLHSRLAQVGNQPAHRSY